MASKVFLDANCLLDLILKRAGFQDAADVIQLGINGDIQLCTTPSVIHVTAYYTSKAFNSQHSKLVLLTLLNDVQIIDCDHATAVMAINSGIDDIEDALQYFTALKFGADYFISSDKKLKKAAIPQLPVYTTTELLRELNTA
jgi:predicted nucleic acid-binding protein